MQCYAKSLFHKKIIFDPKSTFGWKSDILAKICDFLVLAQKSLIWPLYLQRFVQSGGNCKIKKNLLENVFRARTFSENYYFLDENYLFSISLKKSLPKRCPGAGLLAEVQGRIRQVRFFVKLCEVYAFLLNLVKFDFFV